MKEQTSTSKILDGMDEGTKYSTPIFGSEASDVAMPRTEMNDNPVEPRIAYEMIKEYLSIEGNATQNLTTFCQTYMEPMATKIMDLPKREPSSLMAPKAALAEEATAIPEPMPERPVTRAAPR